MSATEQKMNDEAGSIDLFRTRLAIGVQFWPGMAPRWNARLGTVVTGQPVNSFGFYCNRLDRNLFSSSISILVLRIALILIALFRFSASRSL